MTDFPINVIIDPTRAQRGARAVERQLGRIENRANRVGQAIRRAIGFIGGIAAIRGLINLADSFNVLQNRLRVVEKNQGDVNKRFQQLLAISQRVRQPLDAIVTLFQRGSIAADELGISSEQLLEFVEKVGKGLAIQGSNAAESRGALIQLSQALGSGIVRGEEFNAILEGAFPIAQAAARGFTAAGISVAALRRLVIDGKVSSVEFFNAFIKGSESFDATFGKTVPTISQSLTVFKNALIDFIGEADRARGFTKSLSDVILLASKNIDILAKGLIAISVTLGVLYVGAVLNAARATVAFTIALLRNPFGILAVALASLIGVFVAFGDQITIAKGEITTIKDVIDVTFDGVGTSVEEKLSEASESITNFVKKGQDSFKELALGIGRLIDLSFAAFFGFFSGLVAGMKEFARVFFNPLKIAFNNILLFIERSINKIIDDLNKIPGVNIANILIPAEQLKIDQEGFDLGGAFATGFIEGFRGVGVEEFIRKKLEQARKNAISLQIGVPDRGGFLTGPETIKSPTTKKFEEDPDNQFTLSKVIGDLEIENRLLQLNNRERFIEEAKLSRIAELQEVNKDRIEELKALRGTEVTEATERELRSLTTLNIVQERGIALLAERNFNLQIQRDLLDSIHGPREDAIDQLEQLDALFQDGKISIEQYTDAQRLLRIQLLDTSREVLPGVIRGLLKIEEELTNFAQLAENNVARAFGTLKSSLVDFVKTGEFEFKKFFQSLISQLIELFIQLTVILPLAQALKNALVPGSGGGGGGFLGGLGSFVTGLFGGGLGGAQSSAAGINSSTSPFLGPGFAHGGQFRVGGSGGADSQRVSFLASPDEDVTIRTPAQRRRGAKGGDTFINLKMEVGITPTVQAEILNLMPFIKAEVSQAVLDGKQRGGSFGEAFDN